MSENKLDLIREEPGHSTEPQSPAFFKSKELKWEEGKGPFKGLKVAIVFHDRTSGAKGLFLQLPPKKQVDPSFADHYHNATAHTLIIRGAVASKINGKEIVGHVGDYFRAPARWVHGDSHEPLGPDGGDPAPLMFMLIEGTPHDPAVAGDYAAVAVTR